MASRSRGLQEAGKRDVKTVARTVGCAHLFGFSAAVNLACSAKNKQGVCTRLGNQDIVFLCAASRKLRLTGSLTSGGKWESPQATCNMPQGKGLRCGDVVPRILLAGQADRP
jgi:hypothetical protein